MKNVGEVLLELLLLNAVRDGQTGGASFSIIARTVHKPFVLMSFNLQQSTKHVKGHGAFFQIERRNSMRCTLSRVAHRVIVRRAVQVHGWLAKDGRKHHCPCSCIPDQAPPLSRQALEVDKLWICGIKILDAAAG